MADTQNQIETIKQIILEPALGSLKGKVDGLEKKLEQMPSTNTEALEKEIAELKAKFATTQKEIEGIKKVLVGLNKKLSKAFSTFAQE